MMSKQLKALQSYRRAIAWGAANPTVIPPAEGDPASWSPLTRQCHTLSGIAAEISDAASEQERLAATMTLEAADEPALQKQLRDELHVIAQVAQALRKEVPGIGTIRMPAHGVAVERLLNSADALIKRASPYQSVLIEHGLAPDFIAQVQHCIAAIKASIDGRGSARATLKSSTERLAVNVALGRRYVMLMDATLTKVLRKDTAKLVEWKNAKRAVAIAVAGTSDSASSMLASPPESSPASAPQLVAATTPVVEAKAA